ncbi:FMN-binding protein [Massilia solisilvae]|uniref:FMN-binding protein n=1 Tax=Massilia solisilvae TaxID=1811225 RepID=A0ABT2BQG1_9BURK|nr:FMN-binding protein [Massilia solisilvae]MCS0610753.1 FMN-binding protein [Massilia solisilvae]
MRYVPLTLLVAGAASAPAFATQYLSPEQAQKLMFPEADGFKPHPLSLDAAQMRQVEQLSGLPARSVQWRVVGAYKGDALLGYMVLDDVVGKFELISYAVGINPDASVRQVEILTYRESHGGEVRLAAWRKQFVGKTAKGGGLAIGGGIQNISGATLSCTHITDGVRRIAAVAQVALAK